MSARDIGVHSNEDALRNAIIGRPHPAHHEASRPKLSDPFGKKVRDCMELWSDHHNETLNISKEAAKGAVMGIVAASFNSLANRQTIYQGLVLKKVDRQLRKNYFGLLKVTKAALVPYMMAGAVFSVAHHLARNFFFISDDKPLNNLLKVNVPFGIIASAVIFHPKTWWLGAFAGAYGSFVYCELHHGQVGPNRDKNLGFVYQLEGRTEEQLARQRERDLVEEMGANGILQNHNALL